MPIIRQAQKTTPSQLVNCDGALGLSPPDRNDKT
jgi:hypothetical protein